MNEMAMRTPDRPFAFPFLDGLFQHGPPGKQEAVEDCLYSNAVGMMCESKLWSVSH